MGLWRHGALCALITCVLTACGGGGGGGDNNSAATSGPTVQIDRTSLSFQAEQNEVGTTQRITATLSAQPTFDVYIAAEANSPGIASVSMNFPSPTTALVDVLPDTTLSPGTYSGQLVVYACKDEECRTQMPGSPYSVAFTVTIQPGLKLTPTRLDLSAVSGNETSTNVAVQLPAGVSDYQVAVAGDSPSWLSIENRTPSGFTVRTRSTPSGARNVNLVVTAGSRSFGLPISLETSIPPGGEHNLIVTPTALDMASVEGTSAAANLTMSAPTWGPAIQANISYNAGPSGWLSVAPITGGYRVTASAAALSAGTYSANVVITGDEYTQSLFVPVAFTVGAGLVQAAPRNLQVRAETTPADLTGQVTVQLNDGAARTWQATSDMPWLRVTTATGTTGQTMTFQVDQADLNMIPNNSTAVGNITIDAGSPVTPMTFAVSVDMQLPVLRYVTPNVIQPGTGRQVIITGTGFSQLADPASRLSVGNLSGVTVNRRSDTEMVLTLPLVNGGTGFNINLSNGVGRTTRSTELTLESAVVTSSPGVAETRIAQTGTKFALVHDVKHHALFVLNGDLGAIQRHTLIGNTWTSTSLAIASLNGIGLSPDAASLVATTSDGRVLLIDPVSLAITDTFDSGGRIYVMQGATAVLPVTNDGRLWFAQGDGNWNTLRTFDLFTRQFTSAPVGNLSTTFFGGPWGVTSGNGERLLMSQTASVSPQQPLLYLDALDGVLRTVPLDPIADIGYFFFSAYNHDASRLIVDGGRVLDASYATVGRVVLPSGSMATAAFGPDGRRLYVLGYPASFGSPGAPPPTIWVLDATAAQTGTTDLPVLGSFDLTSSPTCEPTPSDSSCYNGPKMVVSPDGNSIYLVGQAAFMAVNIPSALVQANALSRTAKTLGVKTRGMTRRTKRWGSQPTGLH